MSCKRGDIFCRECALSNLLAQKKEIKRAAKARQHVEVESARARVLEDEEDQQRAVQDFELTQAGLHRARKGKATGHAGGDNEDDVPTVTGTKRKFSLDDDELERIAREDKVKARKAIEDEKVGFSAFLLLHVLTSFMCCRLRNQHSLRSGLPLLRLMSIPANSRPWRQRARRYPRAHPPPKTTPIRCLCRT